MSNVNAAIKYYTQGEGVPNGYGDGPKICGSGIRLQQRGSCVKALGKL